MNKSIKEWVQDTLTNMPPQPDSRPLHLSPKSFAWGYNAGVKSALTEVLLEINALEQINHAAD